VNTVLVRFGLPIGSSSNQRWMNPSALGLFVLPVALVKYGAMLLAVSIFVAMPGLAFDADEHPSKRDPVRIAKPAAINMPVRLAFIVSA
jgi:hypothetical protein